MRGLFGTLLLAFLLLASPALAADWTAVKLRGSVFVNDTAGAGKWVRLNRGDTIEGSDVVRTMASGNAEFARGAETVVFGPNTQAQITDRRGQLYTTVTQQFGTVSVSAEARQVQHFAVETPYLVAVVKGTVFTVATNARGSRVVVSRGLVAVSDTRGRHVQLVPAGRAITTLASGATTLSGRADPAQTHPVVNGVVEDQEDPGTPAKTGLGALVGDTIDATGNTVGGLVTDTGGAVGGTLGDVGGALGGPVGGAVSSTGDAVSQTTSSVGSAVGSAVGSVGGAAGSVLGHLGL